MGCRKISDKSITEIANHTTNLAPLRVSSERVTGTLLLSHCSSIPAKNSRIDEFFFFFCVCRVVSCVLCLQALRWF
jgi:hypothetical protein